MVSLKMLKVRKRKKFMKEATELANKYNRIIDYNLSQNFTKFANECFTLVDEFTCDCCNNRVKKHDDSFNKPKTSKGVKNGG